MLHSFPLVSFVAPPLAVTSNPMNWSVNELGSEDAFGGDHDQCCRVTVMTLGILGVRLELKRCGRS